MIVLAIVNQKGGVGKTVTAVNLAHGLALRGYKTLLMDLDPQGNVADCLGLPPGNDLSRLLFPDLGIPLAQAVTPSGRENLDVIRSDKSTANLKLSIGALADRPREYVLDDVLQEAPYDVAVLDCAPSVDILHTLAVVAAHYLLIPSRLDQLAIKGVRDMLVTLKSLARISTCELGAVVPTFYDRTTNESFLQLKHLVDTFNEYVWPPVPQDVVCRECTRFGQTLWEYGPNTRALTGYPNKAGKLIGGYKQVVDRVEEAFLNRVPARRKTSEDEGSFINFGQAAQMADPAVSALLAQGERRQAEAHLPQKDREKKKKEREKMRARRAQHTTYDIPPALRQRMKELSEQQGVPASQLATLALLRFVRDLEERRVDLMQYKVPSNSPRFDFNLVLPVEEYSLMDRIVRKRSRREPG